MSKYRQFIFDSYHFDSAKKQLVLRYGLDDKLSFTEIYGFEFDFVKHDEAVLDRVLQLLFFVAGVSYYKTYLPPEIVVKAGRIDHALADFLAKTYQRGLGEFWYVNQLDPDTPVDFPANDPGLQPLEPAVEAGQLVGLGGGKDSLVTVELLRDQPRVATWSLNHRSQLEPLVRTVGLPHFWVTREWDQQLAEINKQDAYNGHVPISAIFSAVGAIVSILSGYRDAVVSNESSASEPTLHYQGVDINHQYSKSLEYEQDFQAVLERLFGSGPRYYSFLRPFSELRIAELFASLGFDKYRGVFSSCNKAFRHGEHELFWCGECPKCAFVFLALTPFVERGKLESIWGKNLLLDPRLETTYRQLLGIKGNKPLDCVGEIKESRAAMRLAQKIYPELGKYQFELPDDYNFRAWSEHVLPQEILSLLESRL